MSRLIRFFAIGLAFIAAAGVQASALPAEKDADLPVTDVTWEVEIRPGETVSLNGTIQSVYAQVLELNPQFETDMADQIADRMKGLEVAQEEVKGMVKRDHSECGGYGGNMRRINEGIEYLFRLGGSPSIGPGECGRVSCSWNSGIWWCSHRGDSWTAPSWHWIAHAAIIVVQDCSWTGDGITFWTAGRRYHDSHIAVHADYSAC